MVLTGFYTLFRLVNMSVQTFIQQHRIRQAELALAVGCTPMAISFKVRGLRPWKRDEINAVLAFCRQYDPGVTYEELFGATEQVAEREAV